jgi:hypothetical protein
MKLIARCAGREFYARQLGTAPALRDAPFVGSQFACLLWNHSVERDFDAASALLSSLIDDGCRYFVCAGLDCEWWHDLADELFVDKYLDATDEERERNHVMTTWHAQELPDDVPFFFASNTRFNDISFDRFLVLHLGDGPDIDAVDRAVHAQARALAG